MNRFGRAWNSSFTKSGLVVLCLLLVGLVIWGNGFPVHFDVSQVGDLGTWVSSVGTVAAVVVALRESASARRAQRIDQLCSVAAWMDLERRDDGTPRWTVTLLNNTAFPIYRWLATPSGSHNHTGWHLCSSRLGPLVPGPTRYEIPAYPGATFMDAEPIEVAFEDREEASGCATQVESCPAARLWC